MAEKFEVLVIGGGGAAIVGAGMRADRRDRRGDGRAGLAPGRGGCHPSRNRTRATSGEYDTSKEVCMSACTVWVLIWAAAAIVATVFAYRYKKFGKQDENTGENLYPIRAH